MVHFADRISRLREETVFEVAAEAAAFSAEGKKVYPFHLGDLNFLTPQNIVEAALKAIKDGKTGYCPNAGIPQLREALADDINASHNTHYTRENISIQPGGKPAISKFIMTLMNPGDDVLYPNPGFPIYGSQIEFHGGRAIPYTYTEGKDNFILDMTGLESSITPNTKLLILNDLQNPTGAECSMAELEKLAELVLQHDLYVLCDEAYFDIRYEGRSKSLASLPGMEGRCVILYTFGKKFAMTGWRLGAAVGSKEIIEAITKINVNDESCTNHFIQYAAIEGLTGDQTAVGQIVQTLKERRDVGADILNSIDGINCFRPNATFYLYPDITGLMERKGLADYDAFRKTVLRETGISFCTRLHYGSPLEGETKKYLRLAYSGIDANEIKEGLGKLKDWAGSQ